MKKKKTKNIAAALVFLNPLLGILTDWSLNNTLIIIGTITLLFPFISKTKEKHLID